MKIDVKDIAKLKLAKNDILVLAIRQKFSIDQIRNMKKVLNIKNKIMVVDSLDELGVIKFKNKINI